MAATPILAAGLLELVLPAESLAQQDTSVAPKPPTDGTPAPAPDVAETPGMGVPGPQ
jgi:hypothetical protein